MAPHVYLEALNKALNAELLKRGGPDFSKGRRRGRALAALLFGASTVVATTEELPAVAPPTPATTTRATSSPPLVPAHFRPAANRSHTVGSVLSNARNRVETDNEPAQALATLALELGRLQNDIAVRTPDGLEEWIGGEYASLEAVRRAIADTVVDDEEREVVAVALDRAAQLLSAAA
jgi:hypothetical protein